LTIQGRMTSSVNVECNEMLDMTIDTTSKQKVKVIHFGTNRFLIIRYNFLSIVTFAPGHTV